MSLRLLFRRASDSKSLIFIEVGLLLQLSNLEAHVTTLRLEAERMLDGSYLKLSCRMMR